MPQTPLHVQILTKPSCLSREPVIAEIKSLASRLQSDAGILVGLPWECQEWTHACLLCMPLKLPSKNSLSCISYSWQCCLAQVTTLHHCLDERKAHQGVLWCTHCPSALGQPCIVELLIFLLWHCCLEQAAQVEQRPVRRRLLHLLHCTADMQGSALRCRAGRGDTACVMISVTRRGRHTEHVDIYSCYSFVAPLPRPWQPICEGIADGHAIS